MMVFYNPKIAAFSFQLIPDKKRILCKIAKSTQPNVKEIKKGSKIFNWDHSVNFSLTITECEQILEIIKNTKDTSEETPIVDFIHVIKNNNEEDEENTTDNHSTVKQQSFFKIFKKNKGYLIKISKNNKQLNEKSEASFLLDKNQMSLFLKSLNWLTNNLIMLEDLINFLKYIPSQNKNKYTNTTNSNNNNQTENKQNSESAQKIQNEEQNSDVNFDMDLPPF